MSDYPVWDIDGVLEAYANIPEWHASIGRALENLFLFMESNGLLNCRVSDESGKLVKRVIMSSEITAEGDLLSSGRNNAVDKWLRSKARFKDPDDLRSLEKALMDIRAKKL
ncbi:hypothetical protein C4Q28_09255 [Pseudomonas sp. SWI6]|uniref:hypothetical protein n=1 Tax=unclassified Pseudomonas TaxID=196821 RepID=UPI000CE5EB73|nr:MULTISPECIES: hypothetical protein [unclassified Pseudomonas]AVD82342.1 hypothetical protein C4Q28_09255 [Pseudomonas sp. SWI6]AVD88360.1 hypothetical protein C4Q26_14860 [Pseudomonas sp. SWI44]WEZ87231.1 hypothetical protein P3R38_17215 [Pseudomonas sp. NyZ480]